MKLMIKQERIEHLNVALKEDAYVMDGEVRPLIKMEVKNCHFKTI